MNKQGKKAVVKTSGEASQLAATDSGATSGPKSLTLSQREGTRTHRGHGSATAYGSLSSPLLGPRQGTCFHFWVYHLPLPWELTW